VSKVFGLQNLSSELDHETHTQVAQDQEWLPDITEGSCGIRGSSQGARIVRWSPGSNERAIAHQQSVQPESGSSLRAIRQGCLFDVRPQIRPRLEIRDHGIVNLLLDPVASVHEADVLAALGIGRFSLAVVLAASLGRTLKLMNFSPAWS
jgi:hypothetical protein